MIKNLPVAESQVYERHYILLIRAQKSFFFQICQMSIACGVSQVYDRKKDKIWYFLVNFETLNYWYPVAYVLKNTNNYTATGYDQ